MKRRSVMLGLGALAAGSGATFVSGAFDSATTDADADLRVISDGQVAVRGSASDTDVFDLDGEPSDAEAIDFTVDDGEYDLSRFPRATFLNVPQEGEEFSGGVDYGSGNINNNIELTVALPLREDDEFSPLLKVDNNRQVDQEIVIHYENGNESEEDGELYGDDVGNDDHKVSKSTVQEIYQFTVDDTLISPDPDGNETAETGDLDINDKNTGANYVEVPASETVSIALEFDTTGTIVGEINSVPENEPRFGDGLETDVDLLEGIQIQARDAGEE